MDEIFIDYYDLMQLSSSADTDTIERVFRHLAMKFHPDNKQSGDTEKFRLIVDAHRLLSDPEKRAGYDVKYQDYWKQKWKLASEASNKTAFGDDHVNRENLLSILYVQRRRDMRKPGVGAYELARLLSIPPELAEFHMWYLKEKGWVERTETGQFAITASGVEQIEQGRLRVGKDRMLMTGRDASDAGSVDNPFSLGESTSISKEN
jgi:curved DNA-binding protein CbpA